MTRAKLFLSWYKLLRSREYKPMLCISSAWYNSKYYDTDGKYLSKKS